MFGIKEIGLHAKTITSKKYLVIVLFVSIALLRFTHLGYSDYISDEPGTFFYRGGKKDPEMTKVEFILSQRKGPMQLFVGYIPYSIIGNYDNELAQRIPFAIFSTLSAVVFFYLVKKLTKNTFISFASAFLFGVNGLIAAYGRIAQYENLNMFFSFAALYFYADLLSSEKNHYKSTLLGTLMFSFSLLSHWDAVYILIPALYIFIKFLLNRNFPVSYKIKLVFANILLGSLFILPFLIPYIKVLQSSSTNVGYAKGILGLANLFGGTADRFQFEVYNPFLTFYLYVIFGVIGVFFSRKNPIFSIWFLVCFLVFRLFVKYSGLHFYNIFIPLVILVAYAFDGLLHAKSKILRNVSLALLFCTFTFLYYQTYILFVDHRVEYPFERERILFWKTRKYKHSEGMRHKTGFPHKRYWPEINDFVQEQNRLNNESFGYITNEYRPHARFYMDADHRDHGGFYAIGIKRPLSLANDYKFPQIKGKKTVLKIKNEYGNTVARIYRVEDKEDD